MTVNELERRKGFEAGVAFALRHNCNDIPQFITELARLRTWNTYEEWRDLVERNVVRMEENTYGD